MNIQEIDIKKLKPYKHNNRTHPQSQVDLIAASIKDFGFDQPIVINDDFVIIAGHGRHLAAQQLKMKTVPCVISTLEEIKERARRILDNKLQNDSAWDFDGLGFELDFLGDEGFDLEFWGLDALKKLFPEDEPEATDDDFEETEQTETYIKLGDLIELGRHRVLCGDSTSAEDVSELMQGEQSVLMVTDPPYGVSYDANWRQEAADAGHLSKAARAVGKVASDDRVDWTEAYNLFKSQVCYVWHADRHAKSVQQNLEDSNYEIVSQIIWVKNTFAISRGDYHWQHEPCWYAVQKGKNHNWQGSRSESTTWNIKRGCQEKTGHSTEKPIECMAKPVINNTKQGELVSDPFLGSGTTLIACEQLNRTCYGIEIEPKYCQVIIDRYVKFCEDNNKPCEVKINGETWTKETDLD